jgi:uncharacterized ion transporter superfamily protein YfcC
VSARRGFPHPLVLLLGCIAVATALTWVVPAGQYQRRQDEVAGRAVVVPGTFTAADPAPVGLLDAFTAVPRGLIDAASVIFLVFLAGGGFTVVERTGALRRLVERIATRLAGRGVLVIPVVALAFAMGGALMQMSEELVAFAPLLVLICVAFGLPPLTAVALSYGTAHIGAMFSPVNPFMVTIAQKVAAVPVGSGWQFRTAIMVIALAGWLWSLTRYAARHAEPTAGARGMTDGGALTRRHVGVLVIVGVTFLFFVIGAQQWGWDFDKLATLFLLMGLAAGLVGGLGLSSTCDAMIAGARDMVYSALLIGVARGIYVVMDQGRIVDAVVHAVVQPLEGLPGSVAALGMFAAHAVIHLPVPSTSGQAVLTMPIMAPISDLLGLPRQVAVLAYQLGTGSLDLVMPTNGPLLAMLAAVGVRFDDWLKWVAPRVIVLTLFSIACIVAALALGWS